MQRRMRGFLIVYWFWRASVKKQWSFIRSGVVDHKRVGEFHWVWWVSFSALTLLTGCQEGRQACKILETLVPKGSFLAQLEEKSQ